MAHFHVKTKKGRPYLYVREIARVNGKPKVISQTYIGSPEKVAGLVRGRDKDVVTLKVEEFGALWLSRQIDKDIDLCGLIDGIVPPADRETGLPSASISYTAFLTGWYEPSARTSSHPGIGALPYSISGLLI